ncbi:MAG: C4-dicarboxylic acid transporter DauA [Bacteroidales bacterium]|nr:C4-dicarboxylic acid transporter DauA [Bacteroidales bacterium]
MPHRAHLFSLRIGHALRESCIAEPYGRRRFAADVLAGITVGIIAIPLAMALAIASGVAPQYGLYTAIIAGFVIALSGGSRYSVSGPTAAFVVILYPIAQQYGLAGLLLASLMAGGMLVGLALMRVGRFIEYVPSSVTLGFTAGIAVVIATLQVKDLLGLPIGAMPEDFVAKIRLLVSTLPAAHWPSLLVAAATLAVLLWPLKTRLPPQLPAVVVGALVALCLGLAGQEVETIGSRFGYLLPDGSTGRGIPPYLPAFEWPWRRPGADGEPLGISWQLVRELLPAAFAIAMLGAIESLLCAVVLDGMSGKRHSANSELMGQGLGNLIAPFFGGITATAALARSAANFHAGAQSPVAAMVHAVVLLLALVALAPLLAYLPMATMAALLLVVAWNMSEAPKALRLLRTAPRGDLLVFATCFLLTVVVDMVVAITTGVLLAAVLFVREVAEMTRVQNIGDDRGLVPGPVPEGWLVYRITGPLFFAAADGIFAQLALAAREHKGLIIDMAGVTVMDAGGLSAFIRLTEHCKANDCRLRVADLQFQPLRTLARAGVAPEPGVLSFHASLATAISTDGEGTAC